MTDDDFPDETILLIKKVFTDPHYRYTYVVSKLAGKWYVTGVGEWGNGRTWDEILRFLGQGHLVSAKVAATFERVLVVG